MSLFRGSFVFSPESSAFSALKFHRGGRKGAPRDSNGDTVGIWVVVQFAWVGTPRRGVRTARRSVPAHSNRPNRATTTFCRSMRSRVRVRQYRPPSIPNSRPRNTIQADPTSPGREGHAKEPNLQIPVSVIILDGNSQVGFHKSMIKGGVRKVTRAQLRARLSLT